MTGEKVLNANVKLQINLNVRCRGCFKEYPEMHSLYTTMPEGLNLASILGQTTDVVAKENDNFPSYLCSICTTILIDFYNFKIRLQRTHEYIKSLLFKSNSFSSPQPDFVDNDLSDNLLNLDAAIKCEICGVNNFFNRAQLETHMCKKHGTNPFEKFAVFRKQNEERLNAKKRLKLPPEDDPGILCQMCFKKILPEEYDSHWKTHKKFSCSYCGKAFIRKWDMDIHIKSVHLEEKNFICHFCSKAFKIKNLLIRHQVIHTQPFQQICDFCGETFTHRSNLKVHIRLKHDKKREFQCFICGREFSLKQSLEKHIKTHGDKSSDFFCELCNNQYKDRSSLRRHHIEKHVVTTEKPICTICSKTLSCKQGLIRHLDKVHGEKNKAKETARKKKKA